MLVTPRRSVFADILEMRWGGEGGRFTLSHDRSAAMATLGARTPDLIIIDDTVNEADDLCRELRLKKESNMAGIIRLYSQQPSRRSGLWVLENDNLAEPVRVQRTLRGFRGRTQKTADEKNTSCIRLASSFTAAMTGLPRPAT